ncbi:hypothetical protein LWI29_032923 [Acer saccharum]|uniref:DDE Tnp4 domain-containing protein n=1 Tax=Acer saccharum TaxID=4024 RepID=A0AA39T8G8_ACESA|nr:hypothetical protein LWI29_032923 [Acer saccharum]
MSRQPGDLNSPRYAWRVHTSEEEAAKKKSRSHSGFETAEQTRQKHPTLAKASVAAAAHRRLRLGLLSHAYTTEPGYTNGQGFLAPYRGIRYHLQEWADFDRAPRNHKEYFNMKHSQARNIIERCFGLLKKRWAILRSPSFYPIRFQGRVIIACALLHNFIRMYMDVDPEEYTPVTLDDLPIGEDIPNELESIDVVEGSNEWSQWRDDLAREMFDAWR